MKITLEAQDYDDQEKLKRMLNAENAYRALRDIRDEIFRPARKYGYTDKKIINVLDAADTVLVREEKLNEEYGAGTELIGLLEEKFFDLLKDHLIDLSEF
jgi:hypothetical protein